MRVAICEDFEPYMGLLVENIKKHDSSITVDTFTDGVYLISDFVPGKYDIIILDYYMKYLSGIETAKAIRKYDEKVVLIFATNEKDLDIHAVNAEKKMEKPVPQETFNSVMNICKTRLNQEEHTFVEFECQESRRIIKKENICYVSPDGKVGTLNSEFKSINCPELNDHDRFFTNSNGYQINIKRLCKINLCEAYLEGGYKIKIRFSDYFKIRKVIKNR